jgi:hypothetical protein
MDTATLSKLGALLNRSRLALLDEMADNLDDRDYYELFAGDLDADRDSELINQLEQLESYDRQINDVNEALGR